MIFVIRAAVINACAIEFFLNFFLGHRSDLTAAVETMAGAGKVRDKIHAVAASHPVAFIKYHKGFEALAKATMTVFKSPPITAFREWQSQVMSFVQLELAKDMGDDRHILWVYGPRGGEGKSHLVRHLVDHYDAVKLQGRLEDAKHGYMEQPIVLFDLARTQIDTCKHLYSLAEELKNGLIYKTKYESSALRFKPPVVVFWANFDAPVDAWSCDRLVKVHLVVDAFGRVSAEWHYGASAVPKIHHDFTGGGQFAFGILSVPLPGVPGGEVVQVAEGGAGGAGHDSFTEMLLNTSFGY